MKARMKVLVFLLLSFGLFGSVTIQAIDRDEYVSAVIEILRSHVSLMEQIANSDRFKYSDNLVRHAVAIQDTFGLLGPMEWHAAQSARLHLQQQGTGGELDEDKFDDLARDSRNSMRELVRAAHDAMEGNDRQGVLDAIQELKQGCNDCHSLLPKTVAPDLWGPLERK